MKYIFIINPVSGKRNYMAIIKALNTYCMMNNIDNQILLTHKKNEAKKIAESFKYCSDVVLFSVGGDGTLNEVVNGFNNSKAKLGIIPAGTGNDFYRTFKDFKGAKIDLGKVNDRYFVNVASIGLDAEIANYANELKNKNKNQKNVYISSIMHEFFSFKPIDLKIDGVANKSTILTVCNAKYYGEGFKIAPNAILNDGMFDVIDVKSLNKLEIINLIMKLARAQHLQSKHVNYYNTDSLSINSLVSLNCNIDGEIIRDTNFHFTIEKEAINVDVENSEKIYSFLRTKNITK